jgi:hypothetical protein
VVSYPLNLLGRLVVGKQALLLVALGATVPAVHPTGAYAAKGTAAITNLVTAARDTSASVEARIAALDALGKLGTKVPTEKAAQITPLLDPDAGVFPYQRDLFIFHVARALAAIGYNASGAIDRLAQVQHNATSPLTRKAITDAIVAIGTAAEPDEKPDPVKGWLTDLSDKDEGKSLRAAASLAVYLKTKPADRDNVLDKLLDAMKDSTFSSVRRVAAEAAKNELCIKVGQKAEGKSAGPVKKYIEGLTAMLTNGSQPGGSAQEVLFAAREVGIAGANVDDIKVLKLLLGLQDSDDPDIRSVANNALARIKKALK